MIIVDSSVWVDHLRFADGGLAAALDGGLVLVHPFVIGELACGNIANRREVIGLLRGLAPAPVAAHEEFLLFVEARALMGRGIGYVDAHLLASAVLSSEARLWTRDRRLERLARELGVAHEA